MARKRDAKVASSLGGDGRRQNGSTGADLLGLALTTITLVAVIYAVAVT